MYRLNVHFLEVLDFTFYTKQKKFLQTSSIVKLITNWKQKEILVSW